MKKMILIIAVLCFVALCLNVIAADAPAPQVNLTILKEDSGANLTNMNATLAASPDVAVAQVVEFKPPKSGWKLEHILVMATDGWNESSKKNPTPLPFTIEVRDANLRLLYHYADTQLQYFTHPGGLAEIKMADIEVPAITMDGNFFVCFYGYTAIPLLTEVQNATGNSYYYNKPTGQLFSAELPMTNNRTIPVNWIIRAAGE